MYYSSLNPANSGKWSEILNNLTQSCPKVNKNAFFLEKLVVFWKMAGTQRVNDHVLYQYKF